MIVLENDRLSAKIHPTGAELQSLYQKEFKLEYLWDGDPKYWAKHSPVLFPIVGALRDDTYFFKGKEYHLPRHGFARTMEFQAEQLSPTQAIFTLASSAETHALYPFDFLFSIIYNLSGERLSVKYKIENAGEQEMYFSVGGHPAFAIPLVEGTVYEDYYLELERPETIGRWPSAGNLIDTEPVPFLVEQRRIPLRPELFAKDAVVLKDLTSSTISIKNDKNARGICFYLGEFPYLGIWAAKGAPFVCLEPWQGIADSVGHNQQLQDKEGIIRLEKSAVWEISWQVECL